ncbi:unnamed protein product [Orchesella dallaii]|uniref:Protein YIPF n=1 Tax=Orchesella dallaii TaxID=48710 RepID=A0ABP1QZU2_9HEXA
MMQPEGKNSQTPGVHSINIEKDLDLLKTAQGEGDLGSHVEGDMNVGGLSGTKSESVDGEFNTLDEPIMQTITRDLKAVGRKMMGALMPNPSKNLLMKEWDLWGPLILCTYIGLMLQGMDDSSGYQFTELFVLVCLGTAGVTYHLINISHASLSIFQAICVLGYCLGPLAVGVSLFELMNLFGLKKDTTFFRFLIVCGCITWGTYSSTKTLGTTVPGEKQYMKLAPVIVYYSLVGILIFYHSMPY